MMIAAPLESKEIQVIKYLKKNGRTSLSNINKELEFNCRSTLIDLIAKKRVQYVTEYRIQDCGYELTDIYIPSLREGTICKKIYNLIKQGTNRRDAIIKTLSKNYKASTINGRISELKHAGLIEVTSKFRKNKEYIIR